MNSVVRIGTRDSLLATWQAEQVKRLLEDTGMCCELVFIKSDGDLDLITPIYEMGVQGVFTKQLDAALLNNQIDLAVHSMKDIPVIPAKGLTFAAVLPRDNYKDVLVIKDPANKTTDLSAGELVIATGSVRRKAQWLNRYPEHSIENLRGNINTRLRKLAENPWHGAIFAAAGLERLNICGETAIELDWMLPAPAQGIICVTCRERSSELRKLCEEINDRNTQICAAIERDFLRSLTGGCSSPIAALAEIKSGHVHFEGRILSLDGADRKDIQCVVPVSETDGLGRNMGLRLLELGADRIIKQIRNA